MKVQIEEIPKITANFSQPARTRVFKGGRGGGKTLAIAKRSALRVYQLAEMGVEGVFLASREFQGSLDESSMEEIKAAIRSVPWLVDYFDIGEKYIRTKNRRISYAFAGLRHNLDSIKSKARIVGNWTDEAENVSEIAYRKLLPTIRSEGNGWYAENWLTYNPEDEESATHKRYVANTPDDCIVTDINWSDNPWFPEILNKQRLEDKKYRPETYDHIWEGAFLSLTDVVIFSGRTETKEFEPEANWDGPYFGSDFGFSQDPTTFGEYWVFDNNLYCRRDCGKVGLDIDETAQFALGRMPDIDAHVLRADSARPETISYLKRHGLPNITGVKKWAGSVVDGIAHLKSYRKIYIHPDAKGLQREARLYRYETTKAGDILPKVKDADNHYWDNARYALAPLISNHGAPRVRTL